MKNLLYNDLPSALHREILIIYRTCSWKLRIFAKIFATYSTDMVGTINIHGDITNLYLKDGTVFRFISDRHRGHPRGFRPERIIAQPGANTLPYECKLLTFNSVIFVDFNKKNMSRENTKIMKNLEFCDMLHREIFVVYEDDKWKEEMISKIFALYPSDMIIPSKVIGTATQKRDLNLKDMTSFHFVRNGSDNARGYRVNKIICQPDIILSMKQEHSLLSQTAPQVYSLDFKENFINKFRRLKWIIKKNVKF